MRPPALHSHNEGYGIETVRASFEVEIEDAVINLLQLATRRAAEELGHLLHSTFKFITRAPKPHPTHRWMTAARSA